MAGGGSVAGWTGPFPELLLVLWMRGASGASEARGRGALLARAVGLGIGSRLLLLLLLLSIWRGGRTCGGCGGGMCDCCGVGGW